jgi:hypothetical protein
MTVDHRFEGVHSTLRVRRPHPGVIVLTLTGVDIGELGRAPFESLEQDLQAGPIEVFIDARNARSASVDVSREWAFFFRAHRVHIRHVHMLISTRFIKISADLVRDFALLDQRMDVLTDPVDFARRLGDRILAD